MENLKNIRDAEENFENKERSMKQEINRLLR